ncbi:universal stress protein [Phocaeicola faecicola]|uniref:universal stress protein n=1 Tax=Phocaeicola faecicola TaxID=2739389 RepID=UPI002A825BFC|nr:universal stress protein [Phocaeicola faecicola]MCI5742629.1 universal stress protein [Bacteroides sp.]MDD6908547.1 universal stress protein [Bacteroidaceae bacterium]MDY4870981.1 universal stress protein [Phocaeicola faecicola]
MNNDSKLVTLAILTYSKAQILQTILENEGIESYIQNVNLIQPVISSGVRVRINEHDLPQALKVVESSVWLQSEVLNENDTALWGSESKENKILIPVDFSAYSERACDFGFKLADQFHAEVVLLHVYYSPIHFPGTSYDTELYQFAMPEEMISVRNMMQRVHTQFKELAEKVAGKIASGEYPDVKYTCVLKEGVAEEEILRYAKSHKPFIIVMGTRGENEKEQSLIGSVTAEIVERSPAFVYVIPEAATIKSVEELKRIAVFTSFDQRDLIAFDSLVTSFKEQQFEITFVHISSHAEKRESNEKRLLALQDYFRKQYPHLKVEYTVLDDENLLNEVDKMVAEKHIDAICVANYRRNIFARLFNLSVARKMLFHSKTPILVIR